MVVTVGADVRIVTGIDIKHGSWVMVVGLVVVEKCVGHFVVNWGNRLGSKGAGALLYASVRAWERNVSYWTT